MNWNGVGIAIGSTLIWMEVAKDWSNGTINSWHFGIAMGLTIWVLAPHDPD